MTLVQVQMHQKINRTNNSGMGATFRFVMGRAIVVKYSATPLSDNPARPLERNNPKGLQDELIRHLNQRWQDEWLRF